MSHLKEDNVPAEALLSERCLWRKEKTRDERQLLLSSMYSLNDVEYFRRLLKALQEEGARSPPDIHHRLKTFSLSWKREICEGAALNVGLLLQVEWVRLIRRLGDQMQKGRWMSDSVCLISSDDFFLWRKVEQGQLNHPLDAASATCRSIRRHAPVQHPLVGTDIDQGQLWRAERGVSQTKIADLAQVFAVFLQLNTVLREGSRSCTQF